MILLDTSGPLAALNASQNWHVPAAASLVGATAPRLLSPFVLSELACLLAARVGDAARASLLREVERLCAGADVGGGRGTHARGNRAACRSGISVADGSSVVLAHRHGLVDVPTLDRRHFRVLKSQEARSV